MVQACGIMLVLNHNIIPMSASQLSISLFFSTFSLETAEALQTFAAFLGEGAERGAPRGVRRFRGRATQAARARGYACLASWLRQVEALWEVHKPRAMSHKEHLDYHRELSAQFPLAPIRIVYTASGTNLAAAIMQIEEAIIEHKLYWAATATLREVHYLCGLPNSEALRVRVSEFQSQGQWGARDFDKYVFNLPISRFDEEIELHRNVAAASEVASCYADRCRGSRDLGRTFLANPPPYTHGARRSWCRERARTLGIGNSQLKFLQ